MNKKLLYFLVFIVPFLAHAAAVGIYTPLILSHTSTAQYDPSNGKNYSTDYSYESSLGLGLAFDTSFEKSTFYSYRFSLEYLNEKATPSGDFECDNGCTYERFALINTFEFTLYTSSTLKLWMGPRISIAEASRKGNSVKAPNDSTQYKETLNEYAIALSIGANIFVTKSIALSIDLDYKRAHVTGSYSDDSEYYNGGRLLGTAKGFTSRFYLFYMFGNSNRDTLPTQEKAL